MSAESAASFIKFSNSSEPEPPEYHQNLKNKKKNRLIKFLTFMCVGMALVLLVHEAYHWQRGCGRNDVDVERIETIKIITVEKQPIDVGVITLTGDEESETSDSSEEDVQRCVPGTIRKMDCNTCRCNEQGTDFSCTKMACLQMQDEESSKLCTPGHVKMEDCNTCTCNDEGTGYGCTKMACGGLNVNLGNLDTLDLDENEK